ncbi:hypothetical protein LMG28614_06838 [Paraburkholderia ultramafica]|uniref:Uncharacterized protein n=1 Tax=Paraburkholderia ultramafica TaxID=1544867 RepID=A0A6S7CFV5_9BURK|nr:hypothetical protein [Paraburkholderia ultramafica]CAB3808582.1 hypothetical protein LMG28614_06838 [Paraburkholderia ultramafica]
MLSFRGRVMECSRAREALKENFWRHGGADEARMLKTFENDRGRAIRGYRSCRANFGGKRVQSGLQQGSVVWRVLRNRRFRKPLFNMDF